MESVITAANNVAEVCAWWLTSSLAAIASVNEAPKPKEDVLEVERLEAKTGSRILRLARVLALVSLISWISWSASGADGATVFWCVSLVGL